MKLRQELSDIFHERTNYDFIGPKNKWFAVSGLFILIGLAALGLRGLNLGIEFKGGTAWEVEVHDKRPSNDGARAAVEAAGLVDPSIQLLGRPPDSVRVESGRADDRGAGEGPRRPGEVRQRPARRRQHQRRRPVVGK